MKVKLYLKKIKLHQRVLRQMNNVCIVSKQHPVNKITVVMIRSKFKDKSDGIQI